LRQWFLIGLSDSAKLIITDRGRGIKSTDHKALKATTIDLRLEAKLNLKEFLFIHVARWKKLTLDPKSYGILKYTTPITPVQYLEFAEKDLRLGGPRGLINSLANSKRAIDCQIFSLLSVLGIPEPHNFPLRLEKLRDLGLVAPRVIRKIVQLRNVLEHEYYKPTITEVEDALDITALFVATLKPYFKGGSYMEGTWLADELSVNPRGEVTRTKTHTTWRHDAEPRYTYANGVYIDSEIGSKCVHLSLVLDNVEVGVAEIEPKDASYIALQGLLLRAEIDNLPYSRVGANRFLKALQSAAL
jgi:hypothetical protein